MCEFSLTVQKHSLLQALPGCCDYINDPLMAALAPAKQVVPKLAPGYEALFPKQTAYYRMHCIIIEGLYMQYLRPGISATSAMVNFCCTLLVITLQPVLLHPPSIIIIHLCPQVILYSYFLLNIAAGGLSDV